MTRAPPVRHLFFFERGAPYVLDEAKDGRITSRSSLSQHQWIKLAEYFHQLKLRQQENGLTISK